MQMPHLWCVPQSSMHSEQLWVSTKPTVHCTEKPIRWCRRASLIYWHVNTNLEGSLILSSFNRNNIIMFVVGLKNSSTMVSWPDLQYQAHVFSFFMGLESYQKVFSYFNNIPATITTMVLPCDTFPYCVIHSAVHRCQWGKTAEDFLSQYTSQCFLVLWKLDIKEETPWSALTWTLHALDKVRFTFKGSHLRKEIRESRWGM